MSRLGLPEGVERALSQFLARLVASYPDAQAYLFGSHARGTWIEDSDIDVAVVSGKFQDQDFVSRVAALRKLAPSGNPFEFLAYTPQEFRRSLRMSVALQDARRYWRRIH